MGGVGAPTPGLTIHVRRGEVYREEGSSRAFPGWRSEEIHRALTEEPLSAGRGERWSGWRWRWASARAPGRRTTRSRARSAARRPRRAAPRVERKARGRPDGRSGADDAPAARKYGPETADRLLVRLGGLGDSGHLAEVGDWLVECESGEELLVRVERLCALHPERGTSPRRDPPVRRRGAGSSPAPYGDDFPGCDVRSEVRYEGRLEFLRPRRRGRADLHPARGAVAAAGADGERVAALRGSPIACFGSHLVRRDGRKQALAECRRGADAPGRDTVARRPSTWRRARCPTRWTTRRTCRRSSTYKAGFRELGAGAVGAGARARTA